MSTDLAPINGNGTVDLSSLEKVVVGGDLSRLSPGERLQWYQARCHAAGLDPRTQPFQYLQLSGKLTLYATKAATDQLIASRKLTVEICDRHHDRDLGIYEVRCRVSFPDGHHVEDFAALPVHGLKGDALCNALMKCVTKAKRRTVLSACGLGMLDETEVETIPGAVIGENAREHLAIHHNNNTGHGSGAYARPEVVKEFEEWCKHFVQNVNARWIDKWTGHNGEVREGVKDLISEWQLTGHLLKFAREQEILRVPEKPAAAQRSKFLAVWFERDFPAIEKEARRYGAGLWKDAESLLETDDWGDDEAVEVEAQDEPGSDG